MKKITTLIKKLNKHYKKLGFIRGTKWFLFAVRFRVMLFLTGKCKASSIEKEGNLKDSKTPNHFMKKTEKNIFIFSMIPYYDIGGGQRPAQIAKAMNMLGYRVHYIFGMHTSESIIYKMEIPTITHEFVESYSEIDFSNIIKKDDLVIIDFPYKDFMPFFNIAHKKGAKIVYENIDNWESSLGSQLFDKKYLNEVLELSSLLVGTAKSLIEQLKRYCSELDIKREIIYNPNAVNDTLFSPMIKYDLPDDFIKGKKTLLYYGSLWGDWFDWDLLFGVAKKFPKYSFLMIGEKENIRSIVDKAPKNIHFLGIKKQISLPAYLQYADYALIPFKVDKIGEAVSPLKIFEYISMNTLVLSTRLPEVKSYPNTLCGDTVDEWCELLKKDRKVDTVARDSFVDNNNWFTRCLGILESAGEEWNTLDQKLSIIILNHNNKSCIVHCIDSIIRHSSNYSYEIIVVDNKSTDGSYELLRKTYKNKVAIKIVKNDKNGCSSGRNLGVKKSSGEYILFLDSDQFVNRDNWLDQFIPLINTKDVGAIGWAAGWLKKDKNGFSPTVDDYAYRSMPANMLARDDIDYLGSGGMLMKKTVFNEIGGFDERFDPTCYEDTDLSFTIKHAGYKLLYCPYLGIFHLPHQTTMSGELEHNKLFERNHNIFVKKWSDKNPDLLK